MTGDMALSIWTRATGQPRLLGTLMRIGNQATMSYDGAAGDLPGLSVLHDMGHLAGRSVSWVIDPALPLPPCLSHLVPPRNPENLQRLALLRVLDRGAGGAGGGIPSDPIDLEWTLLRLAGRGGIGHIDTFASPDHAAAFYARPPLRTVSLGDDIWSAAERLTSGAPIAPVTEDALFSILGEHPSGSGIMPKLALSVIIDGEDVDVIAKMRDDRHYPGVLPLENLCLDIHQAAQFTVPRHWLRHASNGMEVLFVERFDRANGRPIPLESAFSAMNVAFGGKVRERWTEAGTTPSLEMLGALLTRLEPPISTRPARDAAELYGRLCMALLTGNGDTHLENFAFVGGRGECRLSPVYDPAPMRGYWGHRMLTSVTFGGMDAAICRGASSPNIGTAFVALARSFGLRPGAAQDLFEHCRTATHDYDAMVRASGAPAHVCDMLLGQIAGDVWRLEQAFAAARPTSVPVAAAVDDDDADANTPDSA